MNPELLQLKVNIYGAATIFILGSVTVLIAIVIGTGIWKYYWEHRK